MKKRLLANIFAISIVFLLSFPVFGEDISPSLIPSFGLRKGLLKDLRNDKKEVRNDTKELKKLNKTIFTHILNGEVKSKDGSNLTVEKDGKIYTVQTDGNTQFRRHFWGKSSLAEIAVGDKVNVWGKYVDEGKTTILAKLIRDVSIMKRFGAFIGTVADLSGSTFTLNTVARGAQKVTLNESTKCVNRKEDAISCTSDVQNGHRVRVKGMWDKTNSTVTEVTQLKDYSLPLKPTPSP